MIKLEPFRRLRSIVSHHAAAATNSARPSSVKDQVCMALSNLWQRAFAVFRLDPALVPVAIVYQSQSKDFVLVKVGGSPAQPAHKRRRGVTHGDSDCICLSNFVKHGSKGSGSPTTTYPSGAQDGRDQGGPDYNHKLCWRFRGRVDGRVCLRVRGE